MKIDFLVGDNPYQSTHHFSEKFTQALERQGVTVRSFNVAEGHFYKACAAIMNDPPDLTCSFSDITFGEGIGIGEAWQIPHISFLIDPAIYFFHQIRGEYSFATCVDKEDYEWMRSSGSKVAFLPHGVEREIADWGEERIYEVVFIGTCPDFEKIRASWKQKFPQTLARKLEEVCERVLSNEGISTLKALLDAGIQDNLPLLHHEVDRYIVGKDRVELVNALKGIPVHVWGKGPWKKYVPHANVHPSISFQKSLKIMQKTQVLLNSSARFKQGSHERIFYGLGSGALILTGDNPYIRDHFVEGETILTYQHGKWRESLSKVEEVLRDRSKREKIVCQGRSAVLSHHTWDHRAETLKVFIERSALRASRNR